MNFSQVMLGMTLMVAMATAQQWKFQRKRGEFITFNCSDTYIPTNATPKAWLFPDLQVVNTTYKFQNRFVKSGGWQLQIVNISDRDMGLYHCMLEDGPYKYFMVKRGLNVDGPYFGNVWARYRTNLMIGGIAAAVFLFAIAVIFIVYIFRYREPDPDEIIIITDGANNLAYVEGDENLKVVPLENKTMAGFNVDEKAMNSAVDGKKLVSEMAMNSADDGNKLVSDVDEKTKVTVVDEKAMNSAVGDNKLVSDVDDKTKVTVVDFNNLVSTSDDKTMVTKV